MVGAAGVAGRMSLRNDQVGMMIASNGTAERNEMADRYVINMHFKL